MKNILFIILILNSYAFTKILHDDEIFKIISSSSSTTKASSEGSSSNKNCDNKRNLNNGKSFNKRIILDYIERNKIDIIKNISNGEGEYIITLINMYKKDFSIHKNYLEKLQKRFKIIFPNQDKQGYKEYIYENILQEIKA